MKADSWKPLVAAFQTPSAWKASWQIANSVGGYAILWFLMCLTVEYSWWLTLPLAVLSGALLVRVFIIFHDCGHGSFFASQRANNAWGFVTGVLTFTPYRHWRGQHAVHHGSTGNLDRRGVGDIWTLTVREYLAAPWWKKVAYRIARNPIVLLVIAPLAMFVFEQRLPGKGVGKRERRSVWWTNLSLVAMGFGMSAIMGFWPYVIIQLTVLAVAGAIGIWLFYLQHQFENAYWEHSEDWDFVTAAMKGSAFLKLPKVLQWFSGNIGFHHIHHLNSRIPNYNLQACHESHAMFQEAPVLTLVRGVQALGLSLWDEASKKLVRFGYLKRVRGSYA